MKRLKNKIFITIFLILTISISIILGIYNSTNYIREKNNIINNLGRMNLDHKEKEEPPEKPNNDNIKPEDDREYQRFMDINIYTVIINNEEIDKIISHTKEETTPNEVTILSKKILKNSNKGDIYIGNLFFNKYSYKYNTNNTIVIIDNSNINKELKENLLTSIIVFIIFELIAYIISNLISKWIIKPVEVSFNKQKQFIADASHELKTPLSVIIASTEAYENDKNDKWLKNIESESNRMSNLIKDLLDLAKLENNDLKLSLENTNISKLIEKAILPLESLIYEKNINLDYNIEDNLYLDVNYNEIKQLVSILLDNAIKHSKEDGKILINLKKVKEGIKLEVKNLGDPIPKGEEEKIFERFYRIDKSRNRNENRYGLGLAIAKNICEKHNGKIRAYSNDNFTVFEVIFKK